MKILVTGGAGFIGSHIVDVLINAGHQVRVLDNLEPQVHGFLREQGEVPAYLNPAAEFILGDIRDYDKVSRSLQGVEAVFHEAALVGVGQSMYEIDRYTNVNALGSAVVLQAIINMKERPQKMVVASSMSIYGEGTYYCQKHGVVYPDLRGQVQLAAHQWEMFCPVANCGNVLVPQTTSEDKPIVPNSIYAINKRDHEEMFLVIGRSYNIPTVALRYFNTYGPRQALSNPYTGVAAIFSSRLLNGNPPVIFEDALQSRDFVHVKDIAQANLVALEAKSIESGVYNVGSGRKITILEVAEALTKLMKFTGEPEIAHKFRVGDVRHCFADISKIEALGYRPKVKYEDGLSDLVDWVKRQTATDTFEKARQELEQKGLTI